MSNSQISKISSLEPLVGKTPMIEVVFKYLGQVKKIYAKYEAFNLSGSIKDRIAFHILKNAYLDNKIKEGDIIVEATSGNTGIAFCALGAKLGHKVKIFMPDWLSAERYQVIEMYGGEVVKISKEQGGFLRSIAECQKLAQNNANYFYPNQFANPENIDAHFHSTASEIIQQIESQNLQLSHFIAGVGTGGTVMGFSKYCQKHNLKIACHPLEPQNSPTLSNGGEKIGAHRIQGISDDFIPEIVKLNQLQEIVAVDDGDAINMAQKINQSGLSVGISSGANFIGAVKLLEKSTDDAVVATIFCDSAFKYLSTDLSRSEPLKPDFLSSKISLISWRAIAC